MKYLKIIILTIIAISNLNAIVNIPTTISQEAQIELQNVSTWNYTDTYYINVDKSNFIYGNLEYRIDIPKQAIDNSKVIIYIGDAYNSTSLEDNFASYLTNETNYITYYVKKLTTDNITDLENFIKTIKSNSTKTIIGIGNITGAYLLMNNIDNTNYFDKVILISMFANNTEGDTYNLKFKDGTFFKDREHQLNYNHLKDTPENIFLEDKTIKNNYTSLPDIMFVSGTKDFAYSDTLRTSNTIEHLFINNVNTYILEGMWANFIQHDIPERDKLLTQIKKFINN